MRPSRFGLGFQLTQPERPLGPNPAPSATSAQAARWGFAIPQAGIGFGYVTNDMGPRWQNPRNRALIEASLCQPYNLPSERAFIHAPFSRAAR